MFYNNFNNFLGSWGIGLGTKKLDLNKISQAGQNNDGIILRENGNVYLNGQVLATVSPKPEEGDVIVSRMSINTYVHGKLFKKHDI